MLVLTVAFALTMPLQDPWAAVLEAERAVMSDEVPTLVRAWEDELVSSPDAWEARLGLGQIGLLTYDSLRADAHFQALARRGPGAWRLFGLYGLAKRYVAGNRFLAADSLLTVAVAELARDSAVAASGPRLREELVVSLAQVRVRTRGATAAMAVLSDLGGGAPTTPRARAQAQCLRAEIGSLQGSLDTESAVLGLRAATEAEDYRMRAYCGTMLGGLLANGGLPDSARVVFSGVVNDARHARDAGWHAVGLQWRGFLDRTMGRYGSAAADLEESVARAEAAGTAGVRNWALLNLALLHMDLGNAPAGLRHARRALDGFGRQGDLFQLGSLRGVEAGLLLRSGEHRASLDAYNALAADADAISFRSLAVSARVGGAHAALLAGEPAVARDHVDRILALLQREPGPEAAIAHYAALAVARATADHEGVARHLAWANANLEDDEDFWRYHFDMRAAEVAARAGDLVRATELAEGALAAFHRTRDDLGPRELRLRAFQRSEDLSDPDLGFASVVAALAGGGHAEAALRLSEQSRSGELLREMLRTDVLADRPDAALPRSRSFDGLDALQAALPERAALVSYLTGRGREPTTALVVGREGISAYRLSPVDSMRSAIVRLGRLWSSGGSAPAVAGELGERLIAPLAADPLLEDASRIVVVPHGILYDVPWSALALDDGRLVAERWSVSIVPSAAVLLELWSRPARAEGTRALLLADAPVREDLEPLPATRTEARRVSRFVDDAVLRQGAEAGEAWLKRTDLETFSVVHAATHALTDQTGLAAGLVLAAGEGEDGLLRPGELAGLSLNADLVVLSACHSASGEVLRGEGLRGLVAPVLEAGGRAVIATRWRVADRATARFVVRIYEAMAEGRTVDEALRHARLQAIERGEPRAQWAAFMVVGDGTVRLPLRRPMSPILPALGALLAVGGLGLVLRRRAYGREARAMVNAPGS